jgi:hypothetical protein
MLRQMAHNFGAIFGFDVIHFLKWPDSASKNKPRSYPAYDLDQQ